MSLRAASVIISLHVVAAPLACIQRQGTRMIAEAGACRITEQDVMDRQAVLKITEEGRVVEAGIVLSHLVKPCVGAEIMKKYGHPVTQEILEGEAKRIDESTLMPDVLKKIKEVFGNRREAYLQDYVLPVYVNRVLPYDIVRRNREIQAFARSQAQGWLDRVKANPKTFAEAAKERTGDQSRWVRVSKSGGWEPFDPKDPGRFSPPPAPQGASPTAAGAMAQQQWSQHQESIRWVADLIDGHLGSAKPGTILPEILEFPESFLAARYEKKDGDAYLLRIVGFQKREYDDFFFDAAKEFPIRIKDKTIAEEMQKRVPWTQKFTLRPE